MYHPNDPAYRQARAIKKGEFQLPPGQQAIVDWLAQRLGVKVLDFAFDTKQTAQGYREQIVYVAVETVADARRAEVPGHRQAVADRFLRFIRHENQPTLGGLKSRVHSAPTGKFPPIMVIYRPLEEIEIKVANREARADLDAIQKKYPDYIVSISTNNDSDHTVWFQTDDALQRASADGVTEAILDDYLAAVKKHDEFGYLGRGSLSIRFDSQESLDRDYGGNLWSYYR